MADYKYQPDWIKRSLDRAKEPESNEMLLQDKQRKEDISDESEVNGISLQEYLYEKQRFDEIQRQKAGVSARETYKTLGQHAQTFRQQQFVKDIADSLLSGYNTSAKEANYPEASREAIDINASNQNIYMPGKEFLRTSPLNPIQRVLLRMPNKRKEHDAIRSQPISGALAHEFGHMYTQQQNPNVVIQSNGGKPVPIAVNEAVASWHGYKQAENTWKQYGVPHKAWGAWSGFPTYVQKLSKPEYEDFLAEIRQLESKYPGIENQVDTVINKYETHVRPTMYNIPGTDWTETEKSEFKRFLESRGGAYKDTMPESKEKLIKHLLQQPYVMNEPGDLAKELANKVLAERGSKRRGNI